MEEEEEEEGTQLVTLIEREWSGEERERESAAQCSLAHSILACRPPPQSHAAALPPSPSAHLISTRVSTFVSVSLRRGLSEEDVRSRWNKDGAALLPLPAMLHPLRPSVPRSRRALCERASMAALKIRIEFVVPPPSLPFSFLCLAPASYMVPGCWPPAAYSLASRS